MQREQNDTVGVIILTGGHSQRMGHPKWSLPFGNETLLQRTVRSCLQISQNVVIAANDDQKFPNWDQLPPVIYDRQSDCGPLQGIRGGLEFLHQMGIEWGFVTACDVPKLAPQIADFLLQHAGEFDAVIPQLGKRIFGMTAIYRCKLHTHINSMIENRELRVSQLAERFHCNLIPAESIRSIDNDLESLANLNYPDQYLAALKKMGFTPPAGFPESLQP